MDFYRIENHTIMSGLVVRYCHTKSLFQVSASREGVLIQDNMGHITDPNDLHDLKAILQRAFEQYQSIALSGHGKPFSFGSDPDCVIEHRKAHFGGEDEVLRARPRVHV